MGLGADNEGRGPAGRGPPTGPVAAFLNMSFTFCFYLGVGSAIGTFLAASTCMILFFLSFSFKF